MFMIITLLLLHPACVSSPRRKGERIEQRPYTRHLIKILIKIFFDRVSFPAICILADWRPKAG